MDEQLPDEKRSLPRSPSFPFISLKRALERAGEFAEGFTRHPGRVADAVTHWGYAPKSSGGLQTIAALKAFGLLDENGTGENRKIQLSDLGRRALFDERPGGREAAIRQAALKPKTLMDFWEMWGLDRPPDNACISELTLERKFTYDAAERFLDVYDETISFAKLTKGVTVPEQGSGTMAESIGVDIGSHTDAKSSQAARIERLIDDSGAQIILQFENEPSVEAYEYLRDYLDFKLKRIRRQKPDSSTAEDNQ